MHRHKCPKCGVVWTHGEQCMGDDAAHKCPTEGCGTEERWRYTGDEPATVVHPDA